MSRYEDLSREELIRRLREAEASAQSSTADREALRQSEERFRLFMDHSPTIAWIKDADGRYVYLSRSCEERYGIQRVDCYGKTDVELWPAATAEIFRKNDLEVIARDQAIEVSEETVGADGATRQWLNVKFPMRDGAGRRFVAGVGLEITERMRAQADARQRLREIEDLYRSAPVGLCVLDRDLRWVRINERLAALNGIPAAEHIGRRLPDLLPELARACEPGIRAVFATGEPQHGIEIVSQTPAQPGVTRSWLEHLLPIRDEHGQVAGVSVVVEETTERRRAEEALRDADRRKDEFLATLAHELRNPLVPIRNAVDVIRRAGLPDPALQRAHELIDRQVQHLVRLIDDLLDVSRISRGKLELRREPVALATVLDQAIEVTRPSLERAGHDLAVAMPPQPIHLDADPLRLAQVFCNLLDNACKFTAPGGRIRLSAVRDGAAVVVSVEDSGAGIPPEQLGSVFDMFVQLPGAAERVRSGLGIGLALARGLVEMHGGRIEARSEGPGMGSTFTVRLPATAVPPLPLPGEPAPEAAADTNACRILVVDDHPDVRESLVMLLELQGHEVVTASDGLEAVEAAARLRPDLVLLDLGMPRLDGYGACRRIREQAWGRELTIVALTGWGQDGDRRQTREAGFDDHLVKPVAPSALLDLVARLRPRGS